MDRQRRRRSDRMPGLTLLRLRHSAGRLGGPRPVHVQARVDACDATIRDLLDLTDVDVTDPRDLYCVMVGFIGARQVFNSVLDDSGRDLSYEVLMGSLLRRMDEAMA